MDNNQANSGGFAFTKQQIAAVLSTGEGKELLALLSQDGGAALKSCAQALQSGDTERAQDLIAPLLQSEKARELLAKINEKA